MKGKVSNLICAVLVDEVPHVPFLSCFQGPQWDFEHPHSTRKPVKLQSQTYQKLIYIQNRLKRVDTLSHLSCRFSSKLLLLLSLQRLSN